MNMEGYKRKRPKKMWINCVKDAMKKKGVSMAMERLLGERGRKYTLC